MARQHLEFHHYLTVGNFSIFHFPFLILNSYSCLIPHLTHIYFLFLLLSNGVSKFKIEVKMVKLCFFNLSKVPKNDLLPLKPDFEGV